MPDLKIISGITSVFDEPDWKFPKNQKHPAWWHFETNFLTLASQLQDDAKWRNLLEGLKAADPSSPFSLDQQVPAAHMLPRLKPPA